MGEIMEQPRVAKLEWVEVRSENYDRLVRFYHETLGLPIVFEEEDKNYIQFQVGRSDTYLAILKTRRKDPELHPRHRVHGPRPRNRGVSVQRSEVRLRDRRRRARPPHRFRGSGREPAPAV